MDYTPSRMTYDFPFIGDRLHTDIQSLKYHSKPLHYASIGTPSDYFPALWEVSNKWLLPYEVSQHNYLQGALATDLAELAEGTTIVAKGGSSSNNYGVIGDWRDIIPTSRPPADERNATCEGTVPENQMQSEACGGTTPETGLKIVAPIPIVPINIQSFEFETTSNPLPTSGSFYEDGAESHWLLHDKEAQVNKWRAMTIPTQLPCDRDAFIVSDCDNGYLIDDPGALEKQVGKRNSASEVFYDSNAESPSENGVGLGDQRSEEMGPCSSGAYIIDAVLAIFDDFIFDDLDQKWLSLRK